MGLCLQCIFLFDCINITFGILEVWVVVAVDGGGGWWWWVVVVVGWIHLYNVYMHTICYQRAKGSCDIYLEGGRGGVGEGHF